MADDFLVGCQSGNDEAEHAQGGIGMCDMKALPIPKAETDEWRFVNHTCVMTGVTGYHRNYRIVFYIALGFWKS